MKELQICSAQRVQKKFALFESAKIILVNLIYSALGLFISRGIIFGAYSPFGAAFVASVPYKHMLWSLLGTILGYLLPSDLNSSSRYIATVIAICAIRWTLSDLKKLKKHALFIPLVAFVPMAATGFAMNISEGAFSDLAVMNITEALLSAVGAYFLYETVQIISNKKYNQAFSHQELASLIMSICIIILSLSSFTLGYVSAGKVIATVIILFCAEYMGLAGGSVAGIALGVTFSLSGKSLSYLSGAYSFGGLMAGLLSNLGRPFLIASFVVSNVVISMQTGNINTIISGLYESMIASVIYMVLPDILGKKFMGIFYNPSENKSENKLKKSILTRLGFVSKALTNISSSVNTVSEKLANFNKEDANFVCNRAISDVCANCGFKTLCFETKKSETLQSFKDIMKVLKENSQIKKEDFSESFGNRCKNLDKITNKINEHYHDFTVREAASVRINEVKSFASTQFADMGNMLEDIANEFENYELFDLESSRRIATVLKGLGIIPVDVSCKIDRYNRMFVELEIINKSKEELENLNLEKHISKACYRELDLPCISFNSEKCRIQLSQRPKYKAEIGVFQHVCNNGTFCGDNYTYFNDGVGRIVVILSDGMGTGGRAAIEGAMACEILSTLIKSGVSLKMALKITNSALIIKSEDEFLATVDVACIDLFTGKIEFMKAGSPCSLIKKHGKVKKVDLPSLPVGILNEISVSLSEEKLDKEDVLLMFSDGAQVTDDKWIEQELKNWNGNNQEGFAQEMVEKVENLRKKEGDDDVTVLAIRLSENLRK